MPGWVFWENQGGSAAIADLDGTGRGELVVFATDNPAQANIGYYRVLDRVTDLDTAATKGGQAFLPDGRMLAAGGTAQYDPFFGLRDALVLTLHRRPGRPSRIWQAGAGIPRCSRSRTGGCWRSPGWVRTALPTKCPRSTPTRHHPDPQ